MNYRYIFIFLIILLNSCTNVPSKKSLDKKINKEPYINSGFTLVYNDQLYKDKLVDSKIENRSITIFQKNLKENTNVKITNLINSKYILVKVGKKSNYPYFYNSVISERISKEIEIDPSEPYVEIKEILEGSSFVAKKAKTFDEEKNVVTKVPIEDVEIKILSTITNKKNINKGKTFAYIIKVGDFYFLKSAKLMKSRILKETTIKNVYIDKLSSTKFRVFLGPFNNLNSLKKSFNAINVLEFDSIEIIKK